MRTIKKSDKKSSHIIEIVSCIIFFGFFIIFALITIFKPKETFSELENKSLERKPKLSAKTWFDRTYTDKLEKYRFSCTKRAGRVAGGRECKTKNCVSIISDLR